MKFDKSLFFKCLFSVIILVIFLYYAIYFTKLLTEYWRQENRNEDKKEEFINYQGFFPGNDLKHNLANIFKTGDLNLKEYPNVRVYDDAEFFKDNKFLPECCMYYPDYSGDQGCPCITPEQQFFLKRRGGNRHASGFISGEKSANLYFSPTNAFKGRNDKLFNEFSKEPKYAVPQTEIESKYIEKNYFNIQDR